MSALSSSVEGRPTVRPVRRSPASSLLSLGSLLLQPTLFFFAAGIKEQPLHAATRKHPYKPPPSSTKSPSHASPPSPPLPSPTIPASRQTENIFIDALVRACSCRHRAQTRPAQTAISDLGYTYHRARRRKIHRTDGQIRSLHKVTAPRVSAVRSPIARDEALGMLDYYHESFSTQSVGPDSEPPPKFSSLPPNEALDQPSPESLTFPSTQLHDPSEDPVQPSDYSQVEPPISYSDGPPPLIPKKTENDDHPAQGPLLQALQHSNCTHNEAFEAYSALPSPGVAYLNEKILRLLFRRLSTLERKDRVSQLRYLSVVDDMKSADIPMVQAEWNSTIAFCGQCFARLSAADMESALLHWKEMENDAKVKSGTVTFNILFDMAAKAGKFMLAEMILKEMEVRGLSFNRYSYTSFIYYAGLKADGDAVRRAYRDLVNAGEIINTVVMNCVIASLIRAGELPAAEQVYERMKLVLHNYTEHPLPTPLTWRESRDLGRILNHCSQKYRDDPEKLQQIRDEQLLAPNLHTYAIFVEHHASQTGELRRIAALLAEMHHLGLPMHGRIFLKLFKGFAYHGGIRYTSWTRERLESVWNSLIQALDDRVDDVVIKKWLVIWTVRAFERCSGRERTLEIWEELRKRWIPGIGEEEKVFGVLRDILKFGWGFG